MIYIQKHTLFFYSKYKPLISNLFIVYAFYFIFAPTTRYCYENVFNITTTISVIISIRLFKENVKKNKKENQD